MENDQQQQCNLQKPKEFRNPATTNMQLEKDVWDIARHLMESKKRLPFRKRFVSVLKQNDLFALVEAHLNLKKGNSSVKWHQIPSEIQKVTEELLNLRIESEKRRRSFRKFGLKESNHDQKVAPESPKTYTCVPCGKAFTELKRFKDHERRDRHKASNIYQCHICKKSYGQKSSLICHQRSHTNERPFACHYCNKSFTDQSTYTKHLRVHTGEKPYRCETCNQEFSQSGNCIRHEKKIHEKHQHSKPSDKQPKALTPHHCHTSRRGMDKHHYTMARVND